MIDLRSDTVTRPTAAMLEAMGRAEVGDDVLGEDPTVRALEARLAEMFGQEAGLLCPSGTMANQVAIGVHARPGDEVICAALSHVYLYEGGGIAATSGASVCLLDGPRGCFSVEAAAAAIRPDDPHHPRTRLIAVEDTCNRGGGAIWPRDALEGLRALTRARGLALHLDGARVFNRLVVTGEAAASYGALFDSISVCLSKGLGAPVGSTLLGSASFIAEARRARKRLGGGMRQAGYLAAAGLHALDHHVARLADDHRRAQTLADAAAPRPWVAEVVEPRTNIVLVRLTEDSPDAAARARSLLARGLRVSVAGPRLLRLVTHLDVDDEDVARACAALAADP